MEEEEYDEETKHRSYNDREYRNHEQNLNYLEKRVVGGGTAESGSRGEVVGGGCGGEEYTNGEPAYNGFENGEMNYKSKNEACYNFEREYGRSDTDLEPHCHFQEKEEKVMTMVSTMKTIVSKFMIISGNF